MLIKKECTSVVYVADSYLRGDSKVENCFKNVSPLKDISIAKKRSQSLKFYFSFLQYELT